MNVSGDAVIFTRELEPDGAPPASQQSMTTSTNQTAVTGREGT